MTTASASHGIASSISGLSAQYPVWLCDLWGVVHDGRKAFPAAVDALIHHRAAGGCVILITNAPRPRTSVIPQMRGFGVPDDAWDEVISSGDVTRDLVRQYEGQNVYHLGPAEDHALLEGLPVSWTGAEDAAAILCTGLMNDGRDGGVAETPDDYRTMLAGLQARILPFICANPDRVVGVGGKLYPCAGALADIYEELGGEVLMAGKPYLPIYQAALASAAKALGRRVDTSEALAIGDGLPTDVAGAHANDLAIYFVTDGIHAADHQAKSVDVIADELCQKMPGLKVAGVSSGLVW